MIRQQVMDEYASVSGTPLAVIAKSVSRLDMSTYQHRSCWPVMTAGPLGHGDVPRAAAACTLHTCVKRTK